MHELGIAQNILNIVQQHVPAGQSERVRTVIVRIGDLAGVVADSLEFCFGAITAGTPFDRAHMEIERVPGRAACCACGRESELPGPAFACAFCGAADIRLVAGRELDVVAIELEDLEPA